MMMIVCILPPPCPSGPPVVLPPDSQTAATGVEVSFTCLIQSNLNYTIEWTLNGVPLALNPNIESVGDTLTIHSVLGNHEGSYRCVVTNAVGTTTTQPANLTVCGEYAHSSAL